MTRRPHTQAQLRDSDHAPTAPRTAHMSIRDVASKEPQATHPRHINSGSSSTSTALKKAPRGGASGSLWRAACPALCTASPSREGAESGHARGPAGAAHSRSRPQRRGCRSPPNLRCECQCHKLSVGTMCGNENGASRREARAEVRELSRRSRARVREQRAPSDGRSIVLPIKHSMVERPPRPPPSYKDVGG